MTVIYLGNREREEELNLELNKIISTLKHIDGVEKVILFGSMASGKIGTKSDLDLVIIQKTNKPFISRSIDIMQQINPEVAVDILVYTPEEFTELHKRANSFVNSIIKNGRIIYETKLDQ